MLPDSKPPVLIPAAFVDGQLFCKAPSDKVYNVKDEFPCVYELETAVAALPVQYVPSKLPVGTYELATE